VGNPGPASLSLARLAAPLLICAALARAQCSGDQWLVGPTYPASPSLVSGAGGYPLWVTLPFDTDSSGPEPAQLVLAGRHLTSSSIGGAYLWNGRSLTSIGTMTGGLSTPHVRTGRVFEGSLILGGGFTIVDGQSTGPLARWTGAQWQPVGTGLGSILTSVYSLAELNGHLYAGGEEKTSNSSGMQRLDGAAWVRAYPGGAFTQNAVNEMIPYNGALAVGTSAGVYTFDGTTATRLGSSSIGSIFALAYYQGTLFAGGTNGLYAWDPGAAKWVRPTTPAISSYIFAFGEFEGRLYAGGLEQYFGPTITTNLWSFDGLRWASAIQGQPPAQAAIYSLAEFQGDLYAGGSGLGVRNSWIGASCERHHQGVTLPVYLPTNASFASPTLAGGMMHSSSGSVMPDGTALTGGMVWDGHSWAPGLTFNFSGFTWKTLRDGLGSLLAGGNWYYNSVYHGISRWTGSGWESIGPEMSYGVAYKPPEVRAVCEYGPGLVAAGYFGIGNGAPGTCIAMRVNDAWQKVGDESVLFDSIANTSEYINDAIVFQGRLYVAGQFPGVSACANIACWDGAAWLPVGSGSNGVVKKLIEYNGEMYAAGSFSTMGGVPVYGLARWDGATWKQTNPAWTATLSINSLVVHKGRLAVGGFFRAGDAASETWNLAYFDGAAWTYLAKISGSGSGMVTGLASDGDSLFVTGAFIAVNGIPAVNFVRLGPARPPTITWISSDEICPPRGALELLVMAEGSGPLSFQWQRETSPGVFESLADGPTAAGSLVVGSADQRLLIAGIDPSGAGPYRVVVSNACGAAASQAVNVVVCAADADRNGFVNALDMDLFIEAFEIGLPVADINRDQFVNGDDFDQFFVAFVAGC